MMVIVYQTLVGRNRVWMAWLRSSPKVWDDIHRGGLDREGGIWDYTRSQLRHSGPILYLKDKMRAGENPSSIWDVACNVGFHLLEVESMYPGAQLFASDISHVMVEETERNCKRCHADVFDMGSLIEDEAPLLPFGNRTFSTILLSDVVYYVPFGGYAPIVLRQCQWCRNTQAVLSAQKRLIDRLVDVTEKEIIISWHENNEVVVDMMKNLAVPSVRMGKNFVYIINAKRWKEARSSNSWLDSNERSPNLRSGRLDW